MNKADLVREWFEFAKTDLRVATHLFENMRPRPLEIVCYHCQQSAEKALKGFLIDNEMEPPKTHELEKLCQLCSQTNSSFETILEQCRNLTDYAASARYPGPVEIKDQDAASALKEAEDIYTFCFAALKER